MDSVFLQWPFNGGKTTESSYLISAVYLFSSCLYIQWNVESATLSLEKTLNNCQGCRPRHLSCLPGGFMTPSEAGSFRPSYRTTHLVPADAFTIHRHGWPSGCTAEHQNINTAQTQLNPWDHLQGKQDRLLSLWKTETHCHQGDQCKQQKKRCSVAPNGSLIHSWIVTVMLKS